MYCKAETSEFYGYYSEKIAAYPEAAKYELICWIFLIVVKALFAPLTF